MGTGQNDEALHCEGISIHPLRVIDDPRGSVLHMLRADLPHFSRFGEIYFSEIHPGVIKAWKRHRVTTQNLAVPRGRILLAWYDDRENSPSHGVYGTMEIGRPDAYRLVTIQPNIWYGFQGLGEESALIANCIDEPFDPQEGEHRDVEAQGFPTPWTP